MSVAITVPNLKSLGEQLHLDFSTFARQMLAHMMWLERRALWRRERLHDGMWDDLQ